MDKGCRRGRMALNTMVNGEIIKRTVMENSDILMVICTKGSGLTTKLSVRVFINTRTGLYTMVNGTMICSMDEASKHGVIRAVISASTIVG